MAKLVRDRIPEIIKEKTGKEPKITIATDAEFSERLKEKLQEEVNEFLADENKDEIADILEVLDAWIEFKGINKNSILEVQERKRKERGGFSKRYIWEK